jgi:heat shock protein HslJ
MAAAVFKVTALALACAACTTIAPSGSTFDGSEWRVAAISGRTTPMDGNYYVNFQGGRISGRFGCNNWTGSYSVAGDMLTAGEVAMTRMACIEPANTFENQGVAVLNQPMQWKLIANQQLTLSNGAGSIVMERRR